MRTVIATENKDNRKQLQLLLDKGIKRWFNDRYSLNQVEFTYDKNNQAELNIQQEVEEEISRKLGRGKQNTINQLINWGK